MGERARYSVGCAMVVIYLLCKQGKIVVIEKVETRLRSLIILHMGWIVRRAYAETLPRMKLRFILVTILTQKYSSKLTREFTSSN